MLLFLISALRGIVEMLGLCLLAQGILYPLAGRQRDRNPIYRFFALLSRGPRQQVARLLPFLRRPALIGGATWLILFILWIGLAWLRKFV